MIESSPNLLSALIDLRRAVDTLQGHRAIGDDPMCGCGGSLLEVVGSVVGSLYDVESLLGVHGIGAREATRDPRSAITEQDRRDG